MTVTFFPMDLSPGTIERMVDFCEEEGSREVHKASPQKSLSPLLTCCIKRTPGWTLDLSTSRMQPGILGADSADGNYTGLQTQANCAVFHTVRCTTIYGWIITVYREPPGMLNMNRRNVTILPATMIVRPYPLVRPNNIYY